MQPETQKVKAHYLKMFIAKVESTGEVSIRFSFFYQGYKITFPDESTTWQFAGVVKEIVSIIGTRPFKYYINIFIDSFDSPPLVSINILKISKELQIFLPYPHTSKYVIYEWCLINLKTCKMSQIQKIKSKTLPFGCLKQICDGEILSALATPRFLGP